MLKSQWNLILFWIAAILVVVLATVLYQPAAAKTGSLLIWTRNRVYVMDIDTLGLERVGPADPHEPISPSPGCSGQSEKACWVAISDRLYRVDLGPGSSTTIEQGLPAEEGYGWSDAPVSWSPDGLHIAYYVTDQQTGQTELRLVEVNTGQIKHRLTGVDAAVAAAWSAGCEAGLNASDCKIGYKKLADRDENEFLASLASYAPASGEYQRWATSPDEIFELRWSGDDILLYSRPKRHFIDSRDHSPAYNMPPGSRLANMSPDADYTVYYQPFTLRDCESSESSSPSEEADRCLYLGVWLAPPDESVEERAIIYSVKLSDPDQTSGLNFIPTWSPSGDNFVFFQGGRLIHYDLNSKEAFVWYKSLPGKLRSTPVFSPDEEAVAFVDNQGQGYSEYRLLVINPKLQPIEHIIETQDGFRLLAWLPN